MTGDAFAQALHGLRMLEPQASSRARTLSIAGLRVRVHLSRRRFAEGALRALAHHVVADADTDAGVAPDLTVFVLDHDAPGNPVHQLLPAARSTPVVGDRVERWSYDGAAGRGLLHEGFRALFLWDREHGRAALWLGEDGALPYHLVALPLLPILSWALAARDHAVVHAAAIATDAGALLIGGRSGTGKSTASLACLAAGLGFLGDDMCVIEPGDPPLVHSLYCSGKLDPADTARFPLLAPALVEGSGPWWEKSVYLFDAYLAQRIVRRAPVAGVVIPRRDTAPASRLAPRSAFLAMAPNTVFQLPGAAQAACAGVKRVVSQVPVYAVGVGDRIEAIAPRLTDFARGLRPHDGRAAWPA